MKQYALKSPPCECLTVQARKHAWDFVDGHSQLSIGVSGPTLFALVEELQVARRVRTFLLYNRCVAHIELVAELLPAFLKYNPLLIYGQCSY